MDLIHYVVKDGVLDSAARLGAVISPMDQHGASEVGCSLHLYHSTGMWIVLPVSVTTNDIA
jgi:hypothetical protein